jgi:hypothetical protein
MGGRRLLALLEQVQRFFDRIRIGRESTALHQ